MADPAEPKRQRRLARLDERASDSRAARSLLLPTAEFLRVEARSGWPLLVAALAALAWANSAWSASYFALWHTEMGLDLGPIAERESLRHWINDLLLPLFFFVVGIEVKYELLRGALSDRKRAALPFAAALGGVVVPALVFLALTWGSDASRGWGIPVATDIAFALAILAILGDRVPPALQTLVLAFATIDDVAGVLIIAFFYSSEIAWPPLALAGAALAAVAALSAARVRSIAVFALLGVVVWFCVLRSGVHATIAGVLLGLLVPTRTQLDPDVFEANVEDFTREFQASRAEERALLAEGDPDGADRDALFEGRERREALLGRLEEQIEMMEAPSERLVHRINPWVSYAVLPVFALANAGVALSAESLARTAQDALAWAVAAALVVGKPVGIFGFAWLAAKTRLAHLPQDVGWHHVVGMGLLAGIGFTVSLFIGQLAFPDDAEVLDAAKVAILAASLVAGLAGYGALRWAAARDA